MRSILGRKSDAPSVSADALASDRFFLAGLAGVVDTVTLKSFAFFEQKDCDDVRPCHSVTHLLTGTPEKRW